MSPFEYLAILVLVGATLTLGAWGVRWILGRRRRAVPRPLDEATLATDYFPVRELRRSRLFVYVRKDQIGGETPETVVVAGNYFGTDEFRAVENVPLWPLSEWSEGRLAIQDAFPEMPAADRHFISTGGKWAEYTET
jgi:hypothetical protein